MVVLGLGRGPGRSGLPEEGRRVGRWSRPFPTRKTRCVYLSVR